MFIYIYTHTHTHTHTHTTTHTRTHTQTHHIIMQNPGAVLADAYYLSDDGGSGSAAGSGGGGGVHSLADQVMHAQATYSLVREKNCGNEKL